MTKREFTPSPVEKRATVPTPREQSVAEPSPEIGDCMCDFPDLCDGAGFFSCDGCGGDQCVCLCGGACECWGCDACRDNDDDDFDPDAHDSEGV